MARKRKNISLTPEELSVILDNERQIILAQVEARLAELRAENHRLHHASMSLFMGLLNHLSSIVKDDLTKRLSHAERSAAAVAELRRDVGNGRPESEL